MLDEPLVHRYAPRGSAVEVLGRRDDEVLMSGPAGTGKSRACLEKLLIAALKYDGMRGAIIRKTAASLGSTALRTWREWVAPEFLANGTVDYYGGSAEEPPQYRFSNGSSIVIGGMDRPSKIMSAEYDMIYVQEATELVINDWEAITTRLRNGRMPYQQLIADCNPDSPTHWLKARCDEGKSYMINCRHEDNPRLFDLRPDGTFEATPEGAIYMGKLDRLTGVRYLRLRKGLWAAAEGVIYDEFDPAVHLVDSMPAGWETWRRYWSVDFGFTNPFVLQCWAEDPDGRLWLYRELYHTRRTVDQHARQILDIVAPEAEIFCPDCEGDEGIECRRCGNDRMIVGTREWIEPKPFLIVCDHDAENRRRFEIETGLGTTPADKKVKPGIELTQARYRIQPDGMPRIFFLRSALVEVDQELKDARKPISTIDELPGYVWAPPAPGREPKEEPLKAGDHGMDAKRYLCVEVDPQSRPMMRSA